MRRNTGSQVSGSRVGVLAGLLAAAALTAAPARADVTLTATVSGKMVVELSGDSVVLIKGHKMRNDMIRGSDRTSTIFDVDAGKMITLDHKKKEATIFDIASVSESLAKVQDTDVEVKLTPTSETKQIAGQTCLVHQSDVRVAFSPIEGQKMTLAMTGPVCLAKGAPGHAEYAAFYEAALAKGFFFAPPQAAKAQPGHAKGMAKLQKVWAEAGVPLNQDITMKLEGDGLMAKMMARVAGGTMSQSVTKIDASPIADTEFAVPTGYKSKNP